MTSGKVRLYTKKAKKDSKTQKLKAEYKNSHPIEYIKCSKCGKTNATFHSQSDGRYICTECDK